MSVSSSPSHHPPDPEHIRRLIGIVGAANAITDPADQEPYLREWRGKYVGRTPLVLRPQSAAEVSEILKIANEARIAVVPQAGNTGLVGGQIPSEDGSEIVISLNRMNKIRSIDPSGRTLVAESGVTLAAVQAAAAEQGRLFPLSLASEGSCQIGGNLATNAGGVNVLAYGSARNLVLGLEVVLADGRIWEGLRALKKDNTGYDLRDLFIGSEGTLGIITAAVLKLFPAAVEQATALVALPSLEAARDLFLNAEQMAGSNLTAFEFMSAYCLDIVSRFVPGTRDPFAGASPWIVLIEISSGVPGTRASETLTGILESQLERGLATDAVVASSLAQRQAFWRLREEISDAQRHEGGSIKHDVSVAIGSIPEFVARAGAVVENICPGARPVIFGHLGDGNVHYNVTQPPGMDKAAYLDLWEVMNGKIHELVTGMEGSISAEHGIGRMKRDALKSLRSATEIQLMQTLKSALDPNGILNPGKVI
mgnify:CR=1 FL=1